jgi:ABC-2 type transport system ATP-binding protein
MLTVANFRKAYDAHLVLEVEKLTIPKGLTWFRGINGSGKSTFFKSIAGIVPFEGNVLHDSGLDFKSNPLAFRKMIAYSPAEPHYPTYISGEELLDFYTQTNESNRLVELIETFKVGSYYKDKIQSYSSGMIKKISLIASFMGDSEILALDEPFTTIDVQTQEILSELIRRQIESGKSVMIASHHEMPSLEHSVKEAFMVANQTISK